MPKTLMGYERIKRMHESGDHSRCKFGCCPENPEPNQDAEFTQGYFQASLDLAERLGCDDPRVAVAMDAEKMLSADTNLPGPILAGLGSVAAMTFDLSGEHPDALELLRVASARRLMDDARSGVYHN